VSWKAERVGKQFSNSYRVDFVPQTGKVGKLDGSAGGETYTHINFLPVNLSNFPTLSPIEREV
jgi:hypothetical protein